MSILKFLLRAVLTSLNIAVVLIFLFSVWQIGIVVSSSPIRLVPSDLSKVLVRNPIFIYKIGIIKSLLLDCDIEPYIEDWDGNWLSSVVAEGENHYLIYPTNKFGEGERLTGGIIKTCYLKPFFKNERGMQLFQTKFTEAKYVVGDREYSKEEIHRLISSYTDLSIAVREVLPQKQAPIR